MSLPTNRTRESRIAKLEAEKAALLKRIDETYEVFAAGAPGLVVEPVKAKPKKSRAKK